MWSEQYNAHLEPTDSQIQAFVDTPLWGTLTEHLQQRYKVKPTFFYSCCSMDNDFWKGWNIKYKKRGKALCTLYPKQGYFVALINIGPKEAAEAEVLLELCDAYTQEVYQKTKSGAQGKALALEVTNEAIVNDIKLLVALRAGS